ncbi:MAG: PadR family transcriptional regulator [Actinomycetota bacterium]
MSLAMSLLAILEDRPMYGLELKNEFESRTGWVWPVNVGQVYSTLGRLERDGLVATATGGEAQKTYEPTELGRARVDEWFARPTEPRAGEREERVLKLVMAAERGGDRVRHVIQAERRSGMEELQRYTKLKRDVAEDADLGWTFLLDSLIFRAEARVRWLDACEGRLAATPPGRPGPGGDRARLEPVVRSRLSEEVQR